MRLREGVSFPCVTLLERKSLDRMSSGSTCQRLTHLAFLVGRKFNVTECGTISFPQAPLQKSVVLSLCLHLRSMVTQTALPITQRTCLPIQADTRALFICSFRRMHSPSCLGAFFCSSVFRRIMNF